MMPKPTESEKKIWPTAAAHTSPRPSADQSGVNNALRPSIAPGRKRACTTMITNMITSSGMKMRLAPAMPLFTPRKMTMKVTTHTMSSGQKMWPTNSPVNATVSLICKKSLKKKPFASSPHAPVIE